MFCGTNDIPGNIPHIHIISTSIWGIFYGILLVPQNTVMDLNNVMVT